jgi:hypothetical protein
MKKMKKLSKIQSTQSLHAIRIHLASISKKDALCSCGTKERASPDMNKTDNNSWLGPYIIRKKFDKERYYLTALDGTKMPLPVDGSLLQPHIQVT